jgi:hypothetical protein
MDHDPGAAAAARAAATILLNAALLDTTLDNGTAARLSE